MNTYVSNCGVLSTVFGGQPRAHSIMGTVVRLDGQHQCLSVLGGQTR